MYSALQIELLKWRRTALLWVTVAAALVTSLLVWLMFNARNAPVEWSAVMGQALVMYAVFMGPLIATLIGAQSIASEYQFDTWKLSFTAPVHRSAVYLAKVLLGLIWLAGLSALVFLGSWLAGALLPVSGPLPNPQVWAFRFLTVGLGLSVMLPLYHLVTLIFRSFFVTSGVGIVATFTALIVLNSKYAALYPISSVAVLTDKWFTRQVDTSDLVGSQPAWLAVLGVTFLLPLLVSLLFMKRSDLA